MIWNTGSSTGVKDLMVEIEDKGYIILDSCGRPVIGNESEDIIYGGHLEGGAVSDPDKDSGKDVLFGRGGNDELYGPVTPVVNI